MRYYKMKLKIPWELHYLILMATLMMNMVLLRHRSVDRRGGVMQRGRTEGGVYLKYAPARQRCQARPAMATEMVLAASWKAYINIFSEGGKVNLGMFDSEEEAGIMYARARYKYPVPTLAVAGHAGQKEAGGAGQAKEKQRGVDGGAKKKKSTRGPSLNKRRKQ